MKKRVIAYLHTHWDREWYREFEIFRMRLLRVFDEIIEALEEDLIPSFYFDGQVVALLDYLEMRPENRTRVKDLILAKKLFIAPFYCLIDEFLTSEKLFKKNLELGLKIAKEFGCKDLTGYLPDTFGHSSGVIEILKQYGINECFVWRGCGDLPSEFVWQDDSGNSINATNLIRGYFMDIFTTDLSIEKKAEFLKSNLDKIAEKSSDTLLLPIGADHLGIPTNLKKQIIEINSHLENYEIELGSIFDYIAAVKNNYTVTHKGELRNNSKTFTLEGSYSSRADLKRMNILCSHQIERAEKLVNFYNLSHKYGTLLEYVYKLLLKNQAHDSICGCSTDDTHFENILRYKKIFQIAKTIISEIKFEKKLSGKILNLGAEEFSGVIETTKYNVKKEDIVFKETKGFREDLLADTKKIPITESYLPIYTTLEYVKNVPYGENALLPALPQSQVKSEETRLVGDITIEVSDVIRIIGKETVTIYPRDFKDNGDSYNRGCVKGDKGSILKIKSCRNIFNSPLRGVLEITYENNVRLTVSLDADSEYPKFRFEINNQTKNHHLMLCIALAVPITQTLSEDMNKIISRKFDPNYEIREHLPETKGLEAATNTAPCQRLVWANNVGAVLKGSTQYEVYQNELRINLLRATGIISNPQNSTRTTPAGPPIETPDLQLQKEITQELYVFFGNQINKAIEQIYSFIYV